MSERLDSELSLKAIVGFAVGLVVVLVASAIFLWYFSKYLRSYEESLDPPAPALEAARAAYKPPRPLLQTDPAKEMETLRADEDAILETYAWVDEAGGIARVPIERAITLMIGDSEPDISATVESSSPQPEPAEADH